MAGMKIFISWSGEASEEVANALNEWLRMVVQQFKPFLSSEHIRAGQKWGDRLASELQDTRCGLICVTKQNQSEPWLNFEAGALAKAVQDAESRVIPLAIDLNPEEINFPLAQFQAKPLEKEALRQVVTSLNELCNQKLSEKTLDEAFDTWWPKLDAELKECEKARASKSGGASKADKRSAHDLLEEILTTVTGLARGSAQPSDVSARESAVSKVRATTDKDERARIIKPVLLERVTELREAGKTTLTWPELIQPFPSGGGVRIALRQAFRELRDDGEMGCKVDPEPGPDEGFGGGKIITLET